MILKDIKIFSQNVWKNSLIVNIILEVKSDFNIIFIQEPSWSTVHSILSSMNCEGDSLVECYKLKILELVKRKNLI